MVQVERIERHQILKTKVKRGPRVRATKLSRKIEKQTGFKIHPLLVLVLARFLKAQKAAPARIFEAEVTQYCIEDPEMDPSRVTLEMLGLAETDLEFLSLDEIKAACGLDRHVVENLRDSGILEQERGYQTYRSGAFRSNAEMIPVFRLIEPIASILFPKIANLGF